MTAMGRQPPVGQIQFLSHLLSDCTVACRPKGDIQNILETIFPFLAYDFFSVGQDILKLVEDKKD